MSTHTSTATTTVKFSNEKARAFVRDLKLQVDTYFDAQSLSRKANTAMVVKTVVMLSITFGSYFLILFGGFSVWVMLGLAMLMGAGAAGCGFSVSHDAIHGAYSSNKRINKLLGYTFEINGASVYMWQITHNVIHHTYTNIHGIDEDLEVSPLLRLSPLSDHRPIHRFQHLYVFAAYSLTTLYWVFVKDYMYLLRKDLGPYTGIKHPPAEIAKLVGFKLFYYFYMIVVPMVVLPIPWWQVAIGFVALHLTAGVILSLVFQLAHVVEGTAHFENLSPDKMDDAWIVHEMKTTANFGRTNKALCWYVGGLNFQIEHHLFPKTCSIHYPAISRIVEKVADEYDVPYNLHPTFLGAIGSHWRMLKEYGDPASVQDPALLQAA